MTVSRFPGRPQTVLAPFIFHAAWAGRRVHPSMQFRKEETDKPEPAKIAAAEGHEQEVCSPVQDSNSGLLCFCWSSLLSCKKSRTQTLQSGGSSSAAAGRNAYLLHLQGSQSLPSIRPHVCMQRLCTHAFMHACCCTNTRAVRKYETEFGTSSGMSIPSEVWKVSKKVMRWALFACFAC